MNTEFNNYNNLLLNNSSEIPVGNNASYLSQTEQYTDLNNYRYVGWNQTQTSGVLQFFNHSNLLLIQKKITELLEGVHPENKKIVVAIPVISGVLSEVFENFTPETGSIYSRYTISSESLFDYYNHMTNQAIEIIVQNVKAQMGMDENNKKLTVWTTVLGDFNSHGLRSHGKIKVLNKRPDPMQFNMNY
jgi:hypothetical protein